ncbi:MAG: carbon-nitrogen hydrolase family protein [Halieaceae bacterium]|jgi:nitrilase|nr:carbon-nitrogen hydrolase family protein [Halieaceae bacterium]
MIVKAAAVQMAPVFLDTAATLSKVCRYVEQAADHALQLLVFPETILPGYPYWAMTHDPMSWLGRFNSRLHEQAMVVPGPETDLLCEVARRHCCTIIIGINEKEGGTLYNSQLIISDRGEILGCRRKLVPTCQERMVWGRGDGSDLAVYKTNFGTLGALICYEHSNPLFRYAVQAQGEQIHAANWPGGMPFINSIMDAAIRQYAFESGTFVISATAILTQEIIDELADGSGTEKLQPGGGYSAIVSPGGDYLAGPETEKEGFVSADLDLKQIVAAKIMVDGQGHYARPDVAQLLLNVEKQAPLVIKAET